VARDITISDDYLTWDITMSEDYVAWQFNRFENDEYRGRCALLDTESMEITGCFLVSGYHVLDEMVLCRADRTSSVIQVRDPKNSWNLHVKNEEGNGYFYRQMSYGSQLFVLYTRSNNCGTERMRIWKMRNTPTLLHDRTFEDRDLQIWKVDEQFIAATAFNYQRPMADILYFISTETLEETRTLCVMNDIHVYDRGLLFQCRGNGIIRILDVATGTHFHDVRLPFRKEDEPIIESVWPCASSNSNVAVIGWKYTNEESWSKVSHLSVYDLEAVKNPNSDPGCHLLYTLQFQLDIQSFAINERNIAFAGEDVMNNRFVTLLNFANFSFAEQKTSDLKENVDEVVKMKFFYNSCVES
jgi:hypothetical protein